MQSLRRMVRPLLLGVLIALLAGCGSSLPPEPAATGDTVDRSRLASELYLYTWGDYFNPAVLERFEETYGVKVIMDTYSSSEELLAKLRLGDTGYDVVVPADYAVDIAVSEGLLARLDKANLPNISHLNPANVEQYYDPQNTYSVPYFGGVTGIAYNKEFFPEPPTSWAALFDPEQLRSYGGRVSMLDDEREGPGAALKYLGHSLNTTDPELLRAAEDLLLQQKPYVGVYTSADYHRRLATGETIIAQAWSGGAALAHAGLPDMPGNPNIAFVVPEEGGTRFQDNLAVVADSPNQYTAELFINYLLDPAVAAENTDFVLYQTPNLAALELLAPETQALYKTSFGPPDAETFGRLEWIKRGPDTSIFTELWSRVKGA